VSAQQYPQGFGAFGVTVVGFVVFTNQSARGFALQFRGDEDVDYAFGFIAGLEITLDEHLEVAGNGSMFGGRDVLDAVADVGRQSDGNPSAEGGFDHAAVCASF
jgi:hypothetical protein